MHVDEDDAKKVARTESWRIGDPHSVSRQILNQAAKQWGVTPAPRLKFDRCVEPTSWGKDQISQCFWSDPAAGQEFVIGLARFGFLRHGRSWSAVPWIATSLRALICAAEAGP